MEVTNLSFRGPAETRIHCPSCIGTTEHRPRRPRLTVVVGFRCVEGIVVASDSQISAGPTRRWEQKVWAVDAGFAFGVAGAESTMHLLRDYLIGCRFGTTSASLRDTITAAVASI